VISLYTEIQIPLSEEFSQQGEQLRPPMNIEEVFKNEVAELETANSRENKAVEAMEKKRAEEMERGRREIIEQHHNETVQEPESSTMQKLEDLPVYTRTPRLLVMSKVEPQGRHVQANDSKHLLEEGFEIS
jgi:hypothetical protein